MPFCLDHYVLWGFSWFRMYTPYSNCSCTKHSVHKQSKIDGHCIVPTPLQLTSFLNNCGVAGDSCRVTNQHIRSLTIDNESQQSYMYFFLCDIQSALFHQSTMVWYCMPCCSIFGTVAPAISQWPENSTEQLHDLRQPAWLAQWFISIILVLIVDSLCS